MQKYLVLFLFPFIAFAQMGSDTRLGKFDELDSNTAAAISILKELEALTTGAWKLPLGNTAARPSGEAGQIRYNSELETFEGYTTEWGPIAGGGGLGKWEASVEYAVDDVIWEPTSKKIYAANTLHTSTATFQDDIANWDELSNPFTGTNLTVTTNTIEVTETDGDLNLKPNGTGNLNVTYGTNELNLDPQLQKASIISNGGFERGVTGITCTNATASSEDTIVVNAENNNRSLKIVTDGSVDWSCDIPLKSGMVGGEQFFYSLFSNTSLQTVEVCLFNGTIERNCQELAGISDWYEFYSGLNQAFATTNSLRIKGSDSEATGTVYVDLVDAQLGMPKIGPSKNCANELDCENVFSATVSSAGVVSNESVSGWVSDAVVSGTSVFTFTTTAFSEKPSCVATIDSAAFHSRFVSYDVANSTNASLIFRTNSSSPAAAAIPFSIVCQKAAPDFKPITEQGVVVTGQAQGADFSAYRATSQTIGNATVTFQPSNIVTSDLFSWDGTNFEATALVSGRYQSIFRAMSYNASSGAAFVYFVEVDSGSGFAPVVNRLPCSNEVSDANSRRNSITCDQVLYLNKGDKVRLRMTSGHANSSIFQNLIMTESGAWSIRSVLDRQTIVGDLETRYSTIPSASGLHASVQGGVEEQTGDKWDGKVIYRRCYETTAAFGTGTIMHTLPENVSLIETAATGTVHTILTSQLRSSNYGVIEYDTSNRRLLYTTNSSNLASGTRFCLKYTKP
jgi:hypothetical protein